MLESMMRWNNVTNLPSIEVNIMTRTLRLQAPDSGGEVRCYRSRKIIGSLFIAGLISLGAFVFVPAASASVSIGISVGIAPPAIPVYTQPPCPAPGYMWTPGYWAYDPADGYYWVPGTWVAAPQPGLLWTPGYWGWGGAAFIWHPGYWGPHVGFYGGVNYGFGYIGVGFVGGEWRGGTFFYNRAVVNFGGRPFPHMYDHPVPNNFAINRVSYNGGRGGLIARPTGAELAAEHERHFEASALQHQHEMAAAHDRAQFASVNHGRPGIAASGRPGEFHGAGVVQASRAGGPGEYHGGNAGHPNSYAGGHNANPGGGGGHPLMTTHGNAPASHGNPGSNHQPAFHEAHPQEHSSRESAGGGSHAGGASHGEKPPQHEGNEHR
jgi:hypothetical protein